MPRSRTTIDPEITSHYEATDEGARLFSGTSRLEKVRTQGILERHLPPAPAVVLDVGGGSGPYAFWLGRKGYEVHLVDPMPRHVEEAQRYAQENPDAQIAGIQVGDARSLEFDDEVADVVLFLGPLYHLTELADRLDALREARRVLKEDGLIFAAGISRFASTLDGIFRALLDDPDFLPIVLRDLEDGQHRNPTNDPRYFTTAFFHEPAELAEEMEEAGFVHQKTVPVEGLFWLLRDFDDHWNQPMRRRRLLDALQWLEREPSLLGASAHLLAIARKGK